MSVGSFLFDGLLLFVIFRQDWQNIFWHRHGHLASSDSALHPHINLTYLETRVEFLQLGELFIPFRLCN